MRRNVNCNSAFAKTWFIQSRDNFTAIFQQGRYYLPHHVVTTNKCLLFVCNAGFQLKPAISEIGRWGYLVMMFCTTIYFSALTIIFLQQLLRLRCLFGIYCGFLAIRFRVTTSYFSSYKPPLFCQILCKRMSPVQDEFGQSTVRMNWNIAWITIGSPNLRDNLNTRNFSAIRQHGVIMYNWGILSFHTG